MSGYFFACVGLWGAFFVGFLALLVATSGVNGRDEDE
jgi:hypothetical protein